MTVPFEYSLLGLLVALLVGGLLIAAGVWVHRDASRRAGVNPVFWAVAVPLGNLPAALYYLHVRGPVRTDAPEPTRTDHLLYEMLSVAVVALAVVALLAPPDPFAQIVYAATVLVLALPPVYVLLYRRGEEHR